MKKAAYLQPHCDSFNAETESCFLTGSNIDNPGIGGPGDIIIEED